MQFLGFLFEIWAKKGIMLNDPTVHIYNVHAAIRTIGKAYRSKTLIQRGKEFLAFPSLFCRGTITIKGKYISFYQIGLVNTDKNILIITGRECPTPIDQRATGRGHFDLYTILVQYSLFISSVYGYRLYGIYRLVVRQTLVDPLFRNIVTVADQPIGQHIIPQ